MPPPLGPTPPAGMGPAQPLQPPPGLTLDQAHQQGQAMRAFTLAGPGPAAPPPQITPPVPQPPPALGVASQPPLRIPSPVRSMRPQSGPLDPAVTATLNAVGQRVEPVVKSVGTAVTGALNYPLLPGQPGRLETMDSRLPEQRPYVRPTPTTVGEAAMVAAPFIPGSWLGLGGRAAVTGEAAAARGVVGGAEAAAARGAVPHPTAPPPTTRPPISPTAPPPRPTAPPALAAAAAPKPPVAPPPTAALGPTPVAQTAAPATEALAGEAATAGATPGLGRRMLGWPASLAKADVVTGVAGPARHLVQAGQHLAKGNWARAGNSTGLAALTAGGPGAIYSADEMLNRPGSTYQDRVQLQKEDSSEVMRQPLTQLMRTGESLRHRASAYYDALTDPQKFWAWQRGNAAQAGNVLGAAVRNPEGTGGRVGQLASDVGQHFTTGGAGDQWRGLNQEYAALGSKYHADVAAAGGDPARVAQAYQDFQTSVRELAPRVGGVDYDPPDEVGAHIARGQLARGEARGLLEREMGQFPAAQAAIREMGRMQDDHSMFRTPDPHFDPTRSSMPLPTARHMSNARLYYGQGEQARPSGDAVPVRFLDGLASGFGGKVQQTPEAAWVRQQALGRDATAAATVMRPQVQMSLPPTPNHMGSGVTQVGPGGVGFVPSSETGVNLDNGSGIQGGAGPAVNDENATAQADPAVIQQLQQAPPPVQQELAKLAPNVEQAVRQLGGVPGEVAMTAPAAAAAVANAQTQTAPATADPTLRQYWDELPGSSKVLAIAGLSLAAISFLRSAFGGDDDDEPGFLMKVLPFLGMGAAAWGLGGGTLWDDNGLNVQTPKMDNYKRLGGAAMNSFRDLTGLSLGAAPK